jgi:hypothetical protein
MRNAHATSTTPKAQPTSGETDDMCNIRANRAINGLSLHSGDAPRAASKKARRRFNCSPAIAWPDAE